MKRAAQILFVVLLATAMTGCGSKNSGSGGGSPSPGPGPGPAPRPGPPTLISRMTPTEHAEVKACFLSAKQAYAEEGLPGAQWNETGPVYLITCVMKSLQVMESDLTRQFNKDFVQLYRSLN